MNNFDVRINEKYINDLQETYTILKFERIEKLNDKYVCCSKCEDKSNDFRIFMETQIKRFIRFTLFVFLSERVKRKLSYFSQGEGKEKKTIYKFDKAQELKPNEKYAITNVGHATQLIQIPGFNILTDPVFYNLNWLLYPQKTYSYPTICMLPQIDVIIISHNHRDHLDRDSMKMLIRLYKQRDWLQPLVLVPLGVEKLFRNFGFKEVKELGWYTKISVSKISDKIVDFVSIPVHHRSGRFIRDFNKSLVCAWIVNPLHENVIFKFSGDTRPLSEEQQNAVDAVLWHEIKNKININKSVWNSGVSDIICFEPSGPNYSRANMDVTHQSTSFSALLKLIEAKNLADLSGKSFEQFEQKIWTLMMHCNKYELGVDRFNEGLFVVKKLIQYLDLTEDDLNNEFKKQEVKLERNLDKEEFKKNIPLLARFIIADFLPKQTSLFVHSKNFIIREILEITNRLNFYDKKQIKHSLIRGTLFRKIGEKLNNEQINNSFLDVEHVHKYSKRKKIRK